MSAKIKTVEDFPAVLINLLSLRIIKTNADPETSLPAGRFGMTEIICQIDFQNTSVENVSIRKFVVYTQYMKTLLYN